MEVFAAGARPLVDAGPAGRALDPPVAGGEAERGQLGVLLDRADGAEQLVHGDAVQDIAAVSGPEGCDGVEDPGSQLLLADGNQRGCGHAGRAQGPPGDVVVGPLEPGAGGAASHDVETGRVEHGLGHSGPADGGEVHQFPTDVRLGRAQHDEEVPQVQLAAATPERDRRQAPGSDSVATIVPPAPGRRRKPRSGRHSAAGRSPPRPPRQRHRRRRRPAGVGATRPPVLRRRFGDTPLRSRPTPSTMGPASLRRPAPEHP